MPKRAARLGDRHSDRRAGGPLVATVTQSFSAVDPGMNDPERGELEGSLLARARHPLNPISHAQIEIVLSRTVAAGTVIFALQAMPVMLQQLESRRTEAAIVLAALLGLSILVFVAATLFRRRIRTTAGVVSAIYLVALMIWPLLTRDPTAVLGSKPWLWYLCTVATSCAAIALPVFSAAVYTVLAPVVFGLVRVLPSGGEADTLLAVFDTCYAMLLGGILLIIIDVLREATAKVDTAQSNALEKYAAAVRHHATEVERVEVDSIVHDSVLATLLSAAGVRSEKGAELAALMARSAIIRLQEASGERILDDASTVVSALVDRIRSAAAATGEFTVTELCVEGLSVPEKVAEALYSASVQAMDNSMQHAGPAASRTLTVGGNDHNGCTIKISDTGRGFDVTSVPSARLGLRVSIQERVASVGGVAALSTSPGEGTTIVLTWPRANLADEPVASLAGHDARPSGDPS